jgi:hypothetical protein
LTAGFVGLVVLYGALLRFDALTLKYGPVEHPSWLRSAQESPGVTSALRPAGLRFTPVPLYPHRDGPPTRYRSDPYTYIQRAREMRSFYEAHPREPIFPFVTRIFDWLTRQDVSVSLASTAFSLLAIVATFMLGTEAFSKVVGASAALLLAIEADVISSGVEGWRDDAFVCAVALSAWALLRFRRLPSIANAVLLGLIGGAACLIRITSLSFLVPALAWVVFAAWPGFRAAAQPRDTFRQFVLRATLAAVTMAAVVAPYAINCWRVFGDPLYSINVHTIVYRRAETAPSTWADVAPQGAGSYIGDHLKARPMQTLDTIAQGMTSYPFSNKWVGFDPWFGALGKWLSYASLAGLLLFAASASGRLLLVVLASSLLPFAATWTLAADWRFTEHAYPFYLLAATYAVVTLAGLCRPRALRAVFAKRPSSRQIAGWGLVFTIVTGTAWLMTDVLPVHAAQEALGHDEPLMIVAGTRDGGFFGEGWSRVFSGGNVSVRKTRGARSVIRIPLPSAQDYDLTLRMDPASPPEGTAAALPTVRVLLNEQPLGTVQLVWNPDRVGSYSFRVPTQLARVGSNNLTIVAEDQSGAHPSVAVWYARVQPAHQ